MWNCDSLTNISGKLLCNVQCAMANVVLLEDHCLKETIILRLQFKKLQQHIQIPHCLLSLCFQGTG